MHSIYCACLSWIFYICVFLVSLLVGWDVVFDCISFWSLSFLLLYKSAKDEDAKF